MQLTAALLCIFAPLVGAALTPLFAKIHPKLRDTWAVLAALTAAGATVKSVTVHEADLAEAFRRATGAELQP